MATTEVKTWEVTPKTFGKVLRQLRKARGMTQDDLAARVQWRRRTAKGNHCMVSCYETGRYPPSIPIMSQLASVLQVRFVLTVDPADADQVEEG